MTSSESSSEYCIFLVEDEPLIRLHLIDILEAYGLPVRDAGSRDGARALLARLGQRCRIVFAVLDVDLNGEPVFPIAEQLTAAGVPIIFQTGHADQKGIREAFPRAILLEKPVNPARLNGEIEKILTARQNQGARDTLSARPAKSRQNRSQ